MERATGLNWGCSCTHWEQQLGHHELLNQAGDPSPMSPALRTVGAVKTLEPTALGGQRLTQATVSSFTTMIHAL